MVDVTFPTNTRDEDWLPFNGTARPEKADMIITPVDVPVDILVPHDAIFQDFGDTEGPRVFVLRGSVYIELRFAPGFDPNSLPINRNRSSKSCTQGSRCYGGVEYCCGSNKAVNNCYGRWRC
jgi:hypothetical protein